MAQKIAVSAAAAIRERRHWAPEFVIRLVREKPLGTVGGAIVLVMVLVAILADVISPFGYNESHFADTLLPPSSTYLLGTDSMGRDLLSRIIYGARVSMYVALGAVGLGMVCAVILGITSAYIGGIFDSIAQRFVDTFMTFPWILTTLVVSSILGQGLINVILVLSLFGIRESRIIRSAALSVKENVYLDAARALGCSTWRILFRYILPNVMAPFIIVATVRLGSMILWEATLSFLGYGIPPPFPSWGRMLSSESRLYMTQHPWMAIWPGLALTLAVWGFNVFGDAVRDLLDPRLRGGGTGRFR